MVTLAVEEKLTVKDLKSDVKPIWCPGCGDYGVLSSVMKVIVDKRLGTLTDWVPREDRGKKHYWIAETTVVREAREQGFRFVEYAEAYWYAKDSFALIFQRHGLRVYVRETFQGEPRAVVDAEATDSAASA